jgi:hypothetical protein
MLMDGFAPDVMRNPSIGDQDPVRGIFSMGKGQGIFNKRIRRYISSRN